MELIKETAKLSEMLMLNPYEQLVPYNLWFDHKDYRVVHQTARIRLWNNVALTPVYNAYDVIPKAVIRNMTVYQPFYPEQFYQIYQILSERRLKTNRVLAMCQEDSLGCLEAAIIYHEMHHDHKGTFDSMIKPDNDYLSTYGVTYDQTLVKYDLVIIDLILKQSNVSDLSTDYEETLAACNRALALADTVLVKVSLAQPSGIVGEYIRSSVSHPWNPECYVLVGGECNYETVKNEWLAGISCTKQEPLTYDYLMPISELKTVNPQTFISYKLESSEDNDTPDKSKLIRAKLDLNHVKRVMDTMPTGKRFLTWDSLARDLSISHKIKNALKGIPCCTNAWLKCWELISYFKLLEGNKHVGFHVCEAPGAFVLACQYYARRHNSSYEWFAQTLNVQVNGALDDHFGVIANNPDRWHFGDLTNVDTVKRYAEIKPTFMTADGGVTAEKHLLNEYETLMDGLLLGQVACILACLKVNGCAILKCFLPMSNDQTISLVNVLTECFDEVWLTKPVTSHACNSEVYLVLKGYLGVDPSMLDLMYECMKKHETFECEISKDFYACYEKAVTSLIKTQIDSLHTHYAVYYDKTQVDRLRPIIKRRVNAWLEANKL